MFELGPQDCGSVGVLQNVPIGERTIRVYLPAEYARSEERYPLLLVLSGGREGEPGALTLGKMDHSLDNLIGTSVAPLVVAFVPVLWPEHNPEAAGFARALAEELVPLLEKSYRTVGRTEARGIMGFLDTSFTAAYAVPVFILADFGPCLLFPLFLDLFELLHGHAFFFKTHLGTIAV